MPTKAATKILLTADEQKLLNGLPPAAQALFKGRTETESLTSFETEEELVARMGRANYDKYPEVKAMMEAFGKSGSMDDISFDKLSDGALDTLLFSIGACGICAIIEMSLQQGDVNKDTVEAIGALSAARHRILTVNSSK